jgi:hypothetical protein
MPADAVLWPDAGGIAVDKSYRPGLRMRLSAARQGSAARRSAYSPCAVNEGATRQYRARISGFAWSVEGVAGYLELS